MAEPNWNDPCDRAQALWDAYNRLISGSQEATILYLANGVRRSVTFATVNINQLLNAAREAETDCAIAEGRPPPRRRFAILAGSRRVNW